MKFGELRKSLVPINHELYSRSCDFLYKFYRVLIRLLDLYIILLKQHLERMNDWLVRAESRMALDDVIEPTQEGVEKQVADHEVCN